MRWAALAAITGGLFGFHERNYITHACVIQGDAASGHCHLDAHLVKPLKTLKILPKVRE